MPRVDYVRETPIIRTPRVMQLEGLFDIPPANRSAYHTTLDLPLDSQSWNIGLIVGPSGSGKSTLARELFGPDLITGFDWPGDQSIVDGFPRSMGIKEITGLLSSVGFSSPPAWLRPFRTLSTGEQFRVTLARAIADGPQLAVIDEFTSVVDRTVAQIGSAAIARTVRAKGRRLVAVGCHYDVIDWLQPDWVFDRARDEFSWRLLRRRPSISLEIARVGHKAWNGFRAHHYLSGELNRSARCFVARCGSRVAAFTAVLSQPCAGGGAWREHRTVCLPDFQGVGIGNALSEFVAGMHRATGKPYRSVTSHPGMIAHRLRSPLWRMTRGPSLGHRTNGKNARFSKSAALQRLTATFEFVGDPILGAARKLGVVHHDTQTGIE